MTIKKISLLISMFFLVICLTSCVTITDNDQKFVDKLYASQIGKIEGLVVDLRVRGTEKEEEHTFSKYHIKGAKSFDVTQDEDFASWISKLSNNKVTIFLVDSGNGEYEEILEVLKNEGYITEYEKIEDGKQGVIKVTLKYVNKERVIKGIKRISKPGLRVYAKSTELPQVLNGLGVAIISTSNGVMTDREARKNKLGGEVIAFVW